MGTLGDKIRETKFGDTPVTIYRNMQGQYLLEFERDGEQTIHVCDTNMFWEELSQVIGGVVMPDEFVVIDLIDAIESQITKPLTTQELTSLINRNIEEHPTLMPSYVSDEILKSLIQRLVLTDAGYAPVTDMTLHDFFAHAIRTKMIFTLNYRNYSNQMVRIKKTIYHQDNLYLYLALVNADYNSNNEFTWCEDTYILVKYDNIILEHHKTDELPAEYQEGFNEDI